MSYMPFYDYLTNERITLVEMDSSYYPNKGDIVIANGKKYVVMGRKYVVVSQSDCRICTLLKEQTTTPQPL